MLQAQSSTLLRACAPSRKAFAPVSAPCFSGRGISSSVVSRPTGLRTIISCPRVGIVVRASGNSEKPVVYNKEFGYSRKDIILIGAGLIGLGYALYYGLQAGGMEAGMAGNWVQLIIFMGICVGWVSTYLFRVATKQMTYVKQLEAYEEAVMRKRVEEMTEEELTQLVAEAEAEKARKGRPQA
uniref:Uncharacterized protein n=1 Tax=Chlamydomonas leiostraca TaxID=1034604 RepID=A0A7S0RIX4_9CHLO|eukprot:CAMPEP_0202868056 /NCGR_PEP_ID=MMETSP1391-20130828/10065_1 /ASSEMBLY_ACC=CAM_ASM_000867 /TAXON_ID=1034604 /ORGANISM="Chlamydomonas leiostraca, Strain SAG 11-49" /LENGTH=182 /DNA_ID=CAMNT_0049548157 /DNA_START=37 /DNA_END=585 /DNA_ORIENTATION=+